MYDLFAIVVDKKACFKKQNPFAVIKQANTDIGPFVNAMYGTTVGVPFQHSYDIGHFSIV
jgi:hypothetical protein